LVFSTRQAIQEINGILLIFTPKLCVCLDTIIDV